MAIATPPEWVENILMNADRYNAEFASGADMASGILVVSEDENNVLSATWKEIFSAVLGGQLVFIRTVSLTKDDPEADPDPIPADIDCTFAPVTGVKMEDDSGTLVFTVTVGGNDYDTDSEDGYPAYSGGGLI